MREGGTPKFGGRAVALHILYDFAFIFTLLILSPYIAYRLCTSRRFRAGLKQRLGFVPRPSGEGPTVWIHGVSAGEVKTILPILKRIEQAHGDVMWAISTTTLAGYQMARKLFYGRFLFYFPLDISFIVKKVFRRVKPCLIILMELEIWPNLLYQADRWGVPVIIINGRISENSFRWYRRLRKLLPELKRITLFSVQTQEYRDRLVALDIPDDRIEVTGNIKYDGIDTSSQADGNAVRSELRLSEGDRVLVAGSTHGGEEEMLLDAYLTLRRDHADLRLVLAPRHIERVDDIEKVCLRRHLKPLRRTCLKEKEGTVKGDEILILDTIGELDRVYEAADLVFVGGTLVPVGGHNMMEPAGKGKAVLFGPHVFHFTEDVALLKRHNAAKMVEGAAELEEWIRKLLTRQGEADRLGAAAREAVTKAKGATEQNFELIDAIFVKARSVKTR